MDSLYQFCLFKAILKVSLGNHSVKEGEMAGGRTSVTPGETMGRHISVVDFRPRANYIIG